MTSKADPERAFKMAMAFETMVRACVIWDESRVGHGGRPLEVPLHLPLGVAAAFELELLLKVVLLLEGREPKRVHGLVELFDQIEREAPDAARWIRHSATMHLGVTDADEAAARARGEAPTTFDFALAAADRLFERWRYAFEDEPDPRTEFRAWPIARAAQSYVLIKKRPTWESWVPTVHMLVDEWPPEAAPSYRNLMRKLDGDDGQATDAAPR